MKSQNLSFIVFFAISFSVQISFSKEIINKILVIVNSEIILQSDLKKLQDRISRPGSIDETLLLGEKTESLKNNKPGQIDFLIREKLVESEIKKQSLSITDSRLENEMNQMAKKSQMSRVDFNKFVEKQGFQLEDYKEVLKNRIERQSFFENEIISKLRITDEDAYGEYQIKNPNYRPNVNEFTIAQIFFSPKKSGGTAAYERAQAVSSRIKSGESFEALANSLNETPSANKDGVVGTFKTGEFLADIEKAVSTLSAGSVSEVIKSPAGFHIVKVLSKKTTLDPNFLKVKEMIKASLVEKNFQRQLKNWFESKKQDAYIKKEDSTL